MAAKNEVSASPKNNEVSEEKLKTCFIIMPIADHPDYDKGHFNRVYDYLIKPACLQAGYQPIRADDSKASHMIMFDILKKIMDCDMAICDLSSKNANVFYELGLRQAFNKKTILITDGRDKAPFDISGFRYVSYTPSLRVDSVGREILSIGEMLRETESAPEDDVNSIVKLLKIKPAHVEPLELNPNESMMFSMFSKLQDKLDSLITAQPTWAQQIGTTSNSDLLNDNLSNENNSQESRKLSDLIIGGMEIPSKERFIFDGEYLGNLIHYNSDELKFQHPTSGAVKLIPNTYTNASQIKSLRRRRPRIA